MIWILLWSIDWNETNMKHKLIHSGDTVKIPREQMTRAT